MSEIDILRRLNALELSLETLRKADPVAIRLPYEQRVLNPFPLASSGNVIGDFAQTTAITLLMWRVNVFVTTTNNGTNFWTLALVDAAVTTLASISTSAISAGTWTRLSTTTITQPGSSNALLAIIPTATLTPGTIYVVPELIGAL